MRDVLRGLLVTYRNMALYSIEAFNKLRKTLIKMKSKSSSLLKVNHARAAAAITAGIVCLSMNPASAATITYRNVILADSPIVYYEFDETSGTTADNLGSGGATNDGTLVSTVTINQSSFLNGGTAYDFGGGRVTAAAFSTQTEWTVEAWRRGSTGTRRRRPGLTSSATTMAVGMTM